MKGAPAGDDAPQVATPPETAASHRPPGVEDGLAVIAEDDVQSEERYEDELIAHLERDQFVARTSLPLPRVALGSAARAGLWALRVFVVLLSLMVVYTFVRQLQ